MLNYQRVKLTFPMVTWAAHGPMAYRSSASLHLRRPKQRLFPSGAGRQGRQGTIRQRSGAATAAKPPQRGEATRPPGTMKHPVFDAGRCGFYWEKVWFSQMSQFCVDFTNGNLSWCNHLIVCGLYQWEIRSSRTIGVSTSNCGYIQQQKKGVRTNQNWGFQLVCIEMY